MKFYTYNQNNSGGRFTFDEERGITHFVIIEAEDNDFADFRAEKIGLYFDGCATGSDCSCCGDRWYRQWKDDGSDSPQVYDKHPKDHEDIFNWGFTPNKSTCVHYVDGRKEWF